MWISEGLALKKKYTGYQAVNSENFMRHCHTVLLFFILLYA